MNQPKPEKPTKEFLEKQLESAQRAVDQAMATFHRNSGIVDYLKALLEKGIYSEEEKIDSNK